MKKIVVILILSLFTTTLVAQSTDASKSGAIEDKVEKKTGHDHPPGFKSDGCTMFPDGNYRECCEAHDLDYYKGGKGRRSSDKRLYRCVKAKKGKFFASLVYMGVRIGGVGFLPTPFRWGFGRKKMKKARKKADAERKKRDQAAKDLTENESNR